MSSAASKLISDVKTSVSSSSKASKASQSGPAQWKAVLDNDTGAMYYIDLVSGARSDTCPRSLLRAGQEETTPEGKGRKDKKVDMFKLDEEEKESQEQRLERLGEELKQTQCDLCENILFQPVRLTNCRHVFCQLCVLTSAKYQKQCPLEDCGQVIKEKKLEIDSVHHAQLEASVPAESLATSEARLEQVRAKRKNQLRIVVEYGNTTKTLSNRFEYTSFFKILKVEKGSQCDKKIPDKTNLLKRVEFNINPSYPTSAVKVNRSPYTLTRAMAREYPCFMKAVWSDSLRGVKPLTIDYWVSQKPRNLRMVVSI